MEAWVIMNGNGLPVGIRESESDVIEVVRRIAEQAIKEDNEHTDDEAETLIFEPRFRGDLATVVVRCAATPTLTYMCVDAERFDSGNTVAY